MATIQIEVALLKARVEEVITRQREILDRINKIDDRLDAGDKRFEAADITAAENRGMRKVIFALGSMVLAGLMALGGWLLSYAPAIVKFVFTK